jgi:hypothetical protein
LKLLPPQLRQLLWSSTAASLCGSCADLDQLHFSVVIWPHKLPIHFVWGVNQTRLFRRKDKRKRWKVKDIIFMRIVLCAVSFILFFFLLSTSCWSLVALRTRLSSLNRSLSVVGKPPLNRVSDGIWNHVKHALTTSEI